MAWKIGELARLTGTSAPTIRYYEKIGLLPVPHRRTNGQRRYGDEDVRRLVFIRRCRAVEVPIKQVQTLVSLMENRERSCGEARDIAVRHLETLRARLVELGELERTVAELVRGCNASRADDRVCEPWREARG